MDEQTYSYTRLHLAETLQHVVAQGEAVVISRRGEAEAVLMSVQQFNQLQQAQQSQHGFMARLAQWRETEPEAAINAEDFQPVRQQESGRDFSW